MSEKTKARVLVEGQFHDQVVDVISVRRGSSPSFKPTYRLATIWDGIPYPAWFSEDEIKLIKPDVDKQASGVDKPKKSRYPATFQFERKEDL